MARGNQEMTTAIQPMAAPAPPAAPCTLPAATESRVLLSGIRWQTYLRLLADLDGQRVRLTYDRGNLEIMAPSVRHEIYAKQLGRFVEALADELEIDYRSCRTATFKREEMEGGLEPDDCFYFRNLPRVLGKLEIDLAKDPPPDLAIEIDLTRSSVDRLSVYAALGVPEIWRFDGTVLRVYQLRTDGEYDLCERSPTFPTVPLAKMVEFVHLVTTLDDRNLMKTFRAWVRKEILPQPTDAPNAPQGP
jgi:Uma2 family endonuclease